MRKSSQHMYHLIWDHGADAITFMLLLHKIGMQTDAIDMEPYIYSFFKKGLW